MVRATTPVQARAGTAIAKPFGHQHGIASRFVRPGCGLFSGDRNLSVDTGGGIPQLYAVRAYRFDLEALPLFAAEHDADEPDLSQLRPGRFFGELLRRLGRRPRRRLDLRLHFPDYWRLWRQPRLKQVTAGPHRFRRGESHLQLEIVGPEAARVGRRAFALRAPRGLPLPE